MLGVLAALLPRRYWNRVELAWRVPPRPALSAIVTLVAALCVGGPAFVRHALQGSTHATALTMAIAGDQIRRPADHEVTSDFTQALTILSMVAFVATPVGLISLYLALSGALRTGCVYFDDPMGDPALTAIDTAVRRGAATTARIGRRLVQRFRFGREVPDRVTTGAAVGNPKAEVAVLSARPKDQWTVGTMVIASNVCYRIVEIGERPLDGRVWMAYLLARKTDAGIVRRTVRYNL
jgi:hypothetical protein